MKVLIIPSATLIGSSDVFGNLPSVLFPIEGKPMLDILYEKYSKSVDEIVVVSYERNKLISEYIANRNLPIKNLVLDKLIDLKYSVLKGLGYALDKYKNCEVVINFADTMIELMPNNDEIFYAEAEDVTEDWSYFSFKDGKILNVLDKERKEQQEDISNIFIGVFSFSDASTLYKCFDRNNNFFTAIQDYNKQYKFKFINEKNWFDVGHLDKRFETKLSVKARVFNDVSIDAHRGILKKTSKDKTKFLDEINWYLELPKEIRYLAPRIFDYSLEDNPFVEMEYYSYSTIHELFLYANLNREKWKKIFKSIKFALVDMQKFSKQGDFYDDLKQIYIEKTKDRLEKLKQDNNFKNYFNNNITINKKTYVSLNEIIKRIEDYFNNSFEKHVDFYIIHGDLCFANILIDSSLNMIKLVDPRGSFGKEKIYGDKRYEFAKILHSIEGGYDYIIKDMFALTLDDKDISYSFYNSESDYIGLFKSVFNEILNADINDITFIEALLFLSMIPLHRESFKHQIVMMCRGIEILDKIIDLQVKNG